MNLIPFSLPSGTTWWLLGSVVLNPTKQPCCNMVLLMLLLVMVSLLDLRLRKEEGGVVVVVVMLGGTWVRKGWPFARKLRDWSKVMHNKGEFPLPISTMLITSWGVAVLVILGGAIW